jgi:hypothetical protein
MPLVATAPRLPLESAHPRPRLPICPPSPPPPSETRTRPKAVLIIQGGGPAVWEVGANRAAELAAGAPELLLAHDFAA